MTSKYYKKKTNMMLYKNGNKMSIGENGGEWCLCTHQRMFVERQMNASNLYSENALKRFSFLFIS